MDKKQSFLAKIIKRKNKEKVKDVRPWDLLKGKSEFTKPEIAKERLDICKSCPKFISITQQCKLCFCIMPAKTILAAASCPIGNWHQTDIYADDPIEDGSFSDE
jgi:hypothetical protein